LQPSSSYDVVVVRDSWIGDMAEKPDEPLSDLALSEIYFFKNTPHLFNALRGLIDDFINDAGIIEKLSTAPRR
jgi:dTDP-glucose pyrophosphorylase